jgi:lipopolysaccharide export LptBFGC system permease protein LptF
MQTAYLLPLTALALALAVAALGFRASKRRGFGPFVVGLAAAVGLVVGKFVVDSNAAVYVSVAAVVGASLWNSWPKKSVPAAPTEPLLQLGSIKKEH